MLRRTLFTAAACALVLASFDAAAQTGQIRIGFFPGPYADQFKRGIQPILEKQGYKIAATEFSNAIQPNSALMDGSLDINVFQNRAFMELFNGQNKGDLVEVLRIPSAPLGLYSQKLKSLAEIKDGMSVSMPNDPTNQGRALAFLQLQGLIKLDPAAPAGRATEKNVVENPRKLRLVPLDAPQIPRALADVDLAAALGNHIIAAGMTLTQALVLEDPAPAYQIIIVARAGSTDKPWLKDLVAAYRSPEFRSFVENDPKTKGFSKPDHWR